MASAPHPGADWTTEQVAQFLELKGLAHHVEAFAEGEGVDGAHLHMILEEPDWSTVLQEYGIGSRKEQLHLKAAWSAAAKTSGGRGGRGGRGRGSAGKGAGLVVHDVASQPQSPHTPTPPPPPPPPPPPRRTEWQVHVTPDGQSYYHNPTTGATTWDRPAELDTLRLPPNAEQAALSAQEDEERRARQQEMAARAVAAEDQRRAQEAAKKAAADAARALEAEKKARKKAATNAARAVEAETKKATAEAARRAQKAETEKEAAEVARLAREAEQEASVLLKLLHAKEAAQKLERVAQLEAESKRRAAESRRVAASWRPAAGARNVVLDVANLGHHVSSNSQPQYGRDSRWHAGSWEQVSLAAQFYQCQGHTVHALLNPHTERRIVREFPVPPDLKKIVQVVPVDKQAKDPDDRFILHVAHSLQCQFVSNDNFEDWHERFLQEGEREMVEWLSHNQFNLHVMYMFLDAGDRRIFQPNKQPLTTAPPSPTRSPKSPSLALAASSASDRAAVGSSTGGLTLTYRLVPPLDAPVRSVYAEQPASQTLPDLRTLIARREGKPAEWAACLVLFDRHGHPLRDSHDCDDDEVLKPDGTLTSTAPDEYLALHTLTGLALRDDELLFVVAVDDAGHMANRLETRGVRSWLQPPTSAFGGHHLTFGAGKWHEVGAGAGVCAQSEASTSVLCAVLYCAVTSPICAPEERKLLLGWCWRETHFPPLLHALHSLFEERVTLRPKQRLAIAVGLHALVLRLTSSDGPDAFRPEHAFRALPGLFVRALEEGTHAAAASFPVPHVRQDLTCQSKQSQDKGGVRLNDPVFLEGVPHKLYSRETTQVATRPGFEHEAALDAEDIQEASHVVPLLRRHHSATSAFVLSAWAEAQAAMPPLPASALLGFSESLVQWSGAGSCDAGSWLRVQPALALKDSTTPRPSLTYVIASPTGTKGGLVPQSDWALLSLCEGDGVVGAVEVKGERGGAPQTASGGGKADPDGAPRRLLKVFSPMHAECLSLDVDSLASDVQRLQARLKAPLPGMASVEGQQRTTVTEATLVLFDTSSSMQAAAFPSSPKSNDLTLAEAEAEPHAISPRVFVSLSQYASHEIETAAIALGKAVGAKVDQHRDRETKRVNTSCHLAFPSYASALAAAQRGARGELVVAGKKVKLQLSRERSQEQRSKHREEASTSRLVVAQELFYSFVGRAVAYNAPLALGLIEFGQAHQMSCPLTTLVRDFETHVESVQTTGERTVLWDAVKEATDALIEYRSRHPGCALRVLVLTDGKDEGSSSFPDDVMRDVVSHDIVIDSCVVGAVSDFMLDAAAERSGGSCHRPSSWPEAQALFEADAMISFSSRSTQRRPPNAASLQARAQQLKNLSRGGGGGTPPATGAPRLAVPSEVTAPRATTIVSVLPVGAIDVSSAPRRTRRLMQEACKCRHGASDSAHESVYVYPSEDTISFWHVLMEGPEDTPYENRWFRLWVRFPDEYPLRPPEVRFVTPVLHVNVNHEGRICHGAFGSSYTSDTSVVTLLGEVYRLLASPEPDDPLEANLAERYLSDKRLFEAEARSHAATHAHSGAGGRVQGIRRTPPRALFQQLGLDDEEQATEEGLSYVDAMRFDSASDAVRNTLSRLDEVAGHADAADDGEKRKRLQEACEPSAVAKRTAVPRIAMPGQQKRLCWNCGVVGKALKFSCAQCHSDMYCSAECCAAHVEAHAPFCTGAGAAQEGLALRAKLQRESEEIMMRKSREAALEEQVLRLQDSLRCDNGIEVSDYNCKRALRNCAGDEYGALMMLRQRAAPPAGVASSASSLGAWKRSAAPTTWAELIASPEFRAEIAGIRNQSHLEAYFAALEDGHPEKLALIQGNTHAFAALLNEASTAGAGGGGASAPAATLPFGGDGAKEAEEARKEARAVAVRRAATQRAEREEAEEARKEARALAAKKRKEEARRAKEQRDADDSDMRRMVRPVPFGTSPSAEQRHQEQLAQAERERLQKRLSAKLAESTAARRRRGGGSST